MNYKGLASALVVSVTVLASPVAQADVLYDNGPDTLAGSWQINFSPAVANSFALSGDSILTGVNFSTWLTAGDNAYTVDWTILNGSPGSGGTPLYSGPNASLTFLSQTASGLYLPYNYDVDEETFALPNIDLAAGTYWLELQNEVTEDGNQPAFWGLSAGSSAIWDSWLGNITAAPSSNDCTFLAGVTPCGDSFQILGRSATAVPEPSSLAILGTAFAAFCAARLRKKQA